MKDEDLKKKFESKKELSEDDLVKKFISSKKAIDKNKNKSLKYFLEKIGL